MGIPGPPLHSGLQCCPLWVLTASGLSFGFCAGVRQCVSFGSLPPKRASAFFFMRCSPHRDPPRCRKVIPHHASAFATSGLLWTHERRSNGRVLLPILLAGFVHTAQVLCMLAFKIIERPIMSNYAEQANARWLGHEEQPNLAMNCLFYCLAILYHIQSSLRTHRMHSMEQADHSVMMPRYPIWSVPLVSLIWRTPFYHSGGKDIHGIPGTRDSHAKTI